MSWDAKDQALLKEPWAAGHSAAEIAHRLGYSRNAVSAKFLRMGLKRGHKPPTASPMIIARPVLESGSEGNVFAEMHINRKGAIACSLTYADPLHRRPYSSLNPKCNLGQPNM